MSNTKHYLRSKDHFKPAIIIIIIIQLCAPFNTIKRKYYQYLNEKLEIASNKEDNLLKKGQNLDIVLDIKTSSPFSGKD